MSNSYLDALHIFTKLLQPKLLNLKEMGIPQSYILMFPYLRLNLIINASVA